MKQSLWPDSSGLPNMRGTHSSPDQSPEYTKYQQPKPFAFNRSPIKSELGLSSPPEQVKGMHSPHPSAAYLPDRPLSRQPFGGPPAQVEQQVLAQSLRNENELLRMQLREVSVQDKQHRAQLAMLREHRDKNVAQLVQEQTATYVHEIEQLERALQASEAELRREAGDRQRLEQALEEQGSSAAVSHSQAAAQVRVLETLVLHAAQAVAEMASGVEAFQQRVLPTFKVPPEALPPAEEQRPLEGDKQGLRKQLFRLERGLALLRLMVDAKSDTLVLIRGQLKAEKQALQAEVARLLGQAQQGHVAHQDCLHSQEQERGQLRQELDALQALHLREVQQLQARLVEHERDAAGEGGAVAAVQRELRATAERVAALEGANGRLSSSLEQESGLRAQVVAQLAAQRKEAAATRAELETLKLSQKFLVRQPRGGGRIPPEKMDLMNMLNHLLQQVAKVQAEKAAVEEELKAVRHGQLCARVQGAFSQRDVALAAADKVRDSEVAMKLMRQRLQAREPATAGEEPGCPPREALQRRIFNEAENTDEKSRGALEGEADVGQNDVGERHDRGPSLLDKDLAFPTTSYIFSDTSKEQLRSEHQDLMPLVLNGLLGSTGTTVPLSTSALLESRSAKQDPWRYQYEGPSAEARVLSPQVPERDSPVGATWSRR